MEIEFITEKYTGHRITSEDLARALQRGGLTADLARALHHTCIAVSHVDAGLDRLCDTVTDSITAVRANTTAAPGSLTPTITPLGNSGPRFDLLIALRNDRLEHLREHVHLWRTYGAEAAPADAGPVSSAEENQPAPGGRPRVQEGQ